jgi:hypothetical protein
MQEKLGLKDLTNMKWQQLLKEAVKDESDDLFSIVEPLSAYLFVYMFKLKYNLK